MPDWVEALGTTGALGYIAVQYQRSRTKDQEEKRDAEAAQARLVSYAPLWKRVDDTVSLTFDVNNDSGQVIREVYVEVFDPNGTQLQPIEAELDPDGVLRFVGRVRYWVRSVAPGVHTQLIFFVRPDDVQTWMPAYPDFLPRMRHALRFTDGAGIQWRRREAGAPERVFEAG